MKVYQLIWKEDEQQVTISVKDTGEGINPEILPRLFSKYATKSFEGNGLGLGLFICKSIVESHGGKIWAENNNNDNDSKEKGATFTFNLPLIRSQKTNKIGADNYININE